MKKNTFALGVLAVVSLAMLLPLRAGELDAYVYTNEGKANVIRNGKAMDLTLDMPIKNNDKFRIEPDSWIDYVFFTSIGVRVIGPSDVLAGSVTSLSNVEMHVSGGNVLIHTENAGESFQFSLQTPLAVARVTLPTLAHIAIEPADKKGAGGKTTIFVKRGYIDVTMKDSGASLRVIENQKVEITPETYVPPAQGAGLEDLKLAERARTVYVPKKGD